MHRWHHCQVSLRIGGECESFHVVSGPFRLSHLGDATVTVMLVLALVTIVTIVAIVANVANVTILTLLTTLAIFFVNRRPLRTRRCSMHRVALPAILHARRPQRRVLFARRLNHNGAIVA